MMQLILAEELVKMGIIKFNLDNFILDGVSYSRGASFSQRIQIAAERMCEEYKEQGISCLLVKEGILLTLWLSQPCKVVRDALKTPSPESQFPEISEVQASTEEASIPQTQPQLHPTEKVMTYRGNIYKVSSNINSLSNGVAQNKIEESKKRIYRGLIY
jgi:hypothetical protein